MINTINYIEIKTVSVFKTNHCVKIIRTSDNSDLIITSINPISINEYISLNLNHDC